MKWDEYFMSICDAVAQKSQCLSHKLGAVIVRDRSIIATGYNGPPRGAQHCPGTECPRRAFGFKSGEGLHLCPAVHAEMNAVVNAARKGVSTLDSTLYLNFCIPCKQCMGILMNAGVKEVVVKDKSNYDALTETFRHSIEYPLIRLYTEMEESNVG